MSALELAAEHSAHLDTFEQQVFLLAFREARELEETGGDTEAAWFRARNYPPAAAGHIEGVTSLRTTNHHRSAR